jgi:hypothetical protein
MQARDRRGLRTLDGAQRTGFPIREVSRPVGDWIAPAARGRPGPGTASRLGQSASRPGPAQRAGRSRARAACRASHARSPMPDSPPQRIHALLSAIPAPERPARIYWRRFKQVVEASHRKPLRAAPGGRGLRQAKTWMSCARVGAGRAWIACAACRAPTRARGALRRAGPDRAAALTERKASPGRQGAASSRSPRASSDTPSPFHGSNPKKKAAARPPFP